MALIISLFQVATLAFLTAALSLFIAFCLKDGNIFETYGNWIERKSEENPKLEYWLKPIGGCVYCFGTWVFIGLFVGLIPNTNGLIQYFMVLFLGCGVNYISIDLLSKISE